MSFQFCKEGTPSDPIRRQTVVVYTLTLNVIQTRQLIDLKKSSSLFWMGWIVDQSQERSKLQQDMVSFYPSTSSRKDIAISFKEIHPEWPFCVPTIMREFPQNAVTPATCDLEQNICPVRANACHLNNAINRAIKKSVTDTLPSSCHDLVYLSMCNTENIIPSDPVSWNKDCVNGVCDVPKIYQEK